MELQSRIIGNGLLLWVLLACVALLLPGPVKLQSQVHPTSKQGLQPPSSAPTDLFRCIQSWTL